MSQVPPSQFPPSQFPPAGQMPGAPLKPHRGTMVLVFGILGLVCCIIFAILAWVFGSKDLQEMAAGRMDPSGEGLTKAGKIMGIIGVCLAILGAIVYAIAMATGAAFIHQSVPAR